MSLNSANYFGGDDAEKYINGGSGPGDMFFITKKITPFTATVHSWMLAVVIVLFILFLIIVIMDKKGGLINSCGAEGKFYQMMFIIFGGLFALGVFLAGIAIVNTLTNNNQYVVK